MRTNRNKKGLSNLVAYVLLISITLSLSVMVYGWLKFYVDSEDIEECPENVNIVINGYECFRGANSNLTITLKNKGMFNVDGFVIRVHNRTNADFGIYTIDPSGELMRPGEDITKVYNLSDYGMEYITLVDVQPFLVDSKKTSCDIYASQIVNCI